MRTSFLVAFALLTVLVAQDAVAQPCYSENGGDTFNDSSAMGTDVIGIKFTPTTSLDCFGVEIFTGEKPGVNKLEIWSHDPNINEPKAALTAGTANTGTNNGWHGIAFAANVDLIAGITYWLAWHPVNNAQASVEPPQAGPGQFYRKSSDGGATWGGVTQSPSAHWKFRLYAESAMDEYGADCIGQSGKTIEWAELKGCPCPGNTITLVLDGDGGPVLILLGKDGQSTPITASCDLQINPLHSLVVSFSKPAGPLPLSATIPASTPPVLITAQAFLLGASINDLSSARPIFFEIN